MLHTQTHAAQISGSHMDIHHFFVKILDVPRYGDPAPLRLLLAYYHDEGRLRSV